MERISNRTGVVFQSNHVLEQKVEDGTWTIKEGGEAKNITCKARSYNAFSGSILKLFGFAVKVNGTYYNTKSLAKRMAQAVLHSSVESEKPRDQRDIKNIEVIWKKALTEIKHAGEEFGADQLVTIYNNTLETAREQFQENELDAKYILLQKIEGKDESLLSFLFESVKGEDDSPSLIEGLNQAYGYDVNSATFDSEYIIKENWFKEECLKKDDNGVFAFAKVFEGIHTLDNHNLTLILDILKELRNEELTTEVKKKTEFRFDDDKNNWTQPQKDFHTGLNNLLISLRG